MYIDDGSGDDGSDGSKDTGKPQTTSPQQVPPPTPPQLPDQGQIDDVRSGLHNFYAAADAGHFAVDHTTGNGLIKWAQGVGDWIAEQSEKLRLITQPMPMSETATAVGVSAFMQGVASDAQGLVPQLKALAEELPRYEQAVRKAMRSYRETDERQGDAFRQQAAGG